MNANQLADELQVRYKYEECSECMLEAATMLRQQQEKLNKYELRNIAQCDRIAILESQIKTILEANTRSRVDCERMCGHCRQQD